MTQVYYNIEKSFIRAKGHAGAAPAGQDIICAGISALTLALLNMLIEEEENKNIQLDWMMLPGVLEIQAKAQTEHYRRKVRDYFRITVKGLQAIEENNPGNIELKEVN